MRSAELAHTSPEAAGRRTLIEEEKMRFAATVRRAECRDGFPTRHLSQHRGPLMLPTHGIAAVPELVQPGVRPEVIDVPVGSLGRPRVMRDPGAQASRTQCASDIH